LTAVNVGRHPCAKSGRCLSRGRPLRIARRD
jgi:hypothetical protein